MIETTSWLTLLTSKTSTSNCPPFAKGLSTQILSFTILCSNSEGSFRLGSQSRATVITRLTQELSGATQRAIQQPLTTLRWCKGWEERFLWWYLYARLWETKILSRWRKRKFRLWQGGCERESELWTKRTQLKKSRKRLRKLSKRGKYNMSTRRISNFHSLLLETISIPDSWRL